MTLNKHDVICIIFHLKSYVLAQFIGWNVRETFKHLLIFGMRRKKTRAQKENTLDFKFRYRNEAVEINIRAKEAQSSCVVVFASESPARLNSLFVLLTKINTAHRVGTTPKR